MGVRVISALGSRPWLLSMVEVRLTLSIKIAHKPYIIGSFGPNALTYESFEGKGTGYGFASVPTQIFQHPSY